MYCIKDVLHILIIIQNTFADSFYLEFQFQAFIAQGFTLALESIQKCIFDIALLKITVDIPRG